jgi:hypothetical protein
MSGVDEKIRYIRNYLFDIERLTAHFDYVGGAAELTRNLSEPLRLWRTRNRFFERMRAELMEIAERDRGLLNQTKELWKKAHRAEYLLNLIVEDSTVPSDDTDASIRFVVEDEALRSSPLIIGELGRQALFGVSPAVRRLPWLNIYRQLSHGPGTVAALPPRTRNRPPSPALFIGGIATGEVEGATLRNLREEIVGSRKVLGPRGTILEPAAAEEGHESLIPTLLAALVSSGDADRNEVALTLGEIGGEVVATFLADALRSELTAAARAGVAGGAFEEEYLVNLVSALANIGGPDAVQGLLRAAEEGSERVRLVALSGLEALATAGSVALIESPEPVRIDSEEKYQAYLRLAERLRGLTSARVTPAYVRHKARGLLETVMVSLNSARLPV